MNAPQTAEPLRKFATGRKSEDFVNHACLTRFDLSGFKPPGFQFAKKGAQINTLSEPLPDTIRAKVKTRGMRLTRYVHIWTEQDAARP